MKDDALAHLYEILHAVCFRFEGGHAYDVEIVNYH